MEKNERELVHREWGNFDAVLALWKEYVWPAAEDQACMLPGDNGLD